MHNVAEASEPPAPEHIALGAFIRGHGPAIIEEWTRFAGTQTPAAESMSRLALRDHIREILIFLADDLESVQTDAEQVSKSHGEEPDDGGGAQSVAEVHAALRLLDGFDINQLFAEYRALRASVIRLWGKSNRRPTRKDFDQRTRFNEAIDQVTAESISHYAKTLDHSRNLFLGVLSHDLRNPLNAVVMSADLLARVGPLSAKQADLAAQIKDCALRADRIIADLLDLTTIRFGAELPIARERMDMAALGRQLVQEMQAAYPGRAIALELTGDTEGEWDRARMGQVFANLIGNAMEHGFRDTPVDVAVTGRPQDVTLSVRNQGKPIPADKIGQIFDALVRGEADSDRHFSSSHLGLGLFITKRIVQSHDGTVSVTSGEDGTSFSATLPRH